jgi:hypothetical protein
MALCAPVLSPKTEDRIWSSNYITFDLVFNADSKSDIFIG